MKKFVSGTLRNYILAGTASVIMAGMPKQVAAQSPQDSKVETVDFKPNSEREKNIYNATYDLLLVNMSEDNAEKFASDILLNARKYDNKNARRFIEGAVKVALGEKYGKMLEESIAEVAQADSQGTEKTPDSSQGKAKEETVKVSILSVSKLSPEQLQEYNLLKAKVEIAYALKGINPHGTMSATMLRVYNSPKRVEEFNALTNGVKFKDLEGDNFVAYNTKNGKYSIWAKADEKEAIEKKIKKAGGAAKYMEISSAQDAKEVPSRRSLNFNGR